jgi:arylsulfatase A-like enzyme
LKPNIILVLLDGSRWDRTNISSNFLDLQKRGTFVNNVTTAAPYTFASVNTIFTGKYGKENGVNAYYKMFRLKDSINFLPELLQKNGYFTTCNLISKKVISSRGFNIYSSHNEYEDDLILKHPNLIKEYFEKSKNKPLFTFLQFSAIHTATVSEVLKKYEWNDENFYTRKKENLEIYDLAFKKASIYAKKIFQTIEDLGKSNETIIIFFSDHGTGIGERFGERNYGVFTYEETIRTFYLFLGDLISKNKKSDSLLRTIDILPTILDLCKIKIPLDLTGESFSSYLLNSNEKLSDTSFTFSETGGLQGPFPSPMEPNVFCIKSSTHKLIYFMSANKWKLFDLKNDPNEINNIYDTGLKLEGKLKENLFSWINREIS